MAEIVDLIIVVDVVLLGLPHQFLVELPLPPGQVDLECAVHSCVDQFLCFYIDFGLYGVVVNDEGPILLWETLYLLLLLLSFLASGTHL